MIINAESPAAGLIPEQNLMEQKQNHVWIQSESRST